jgi:hypothetical protein
MESSFVPPVFEKALDNRLNRIKITSDRLSMKCWIHQAKNYHLLLYMQVAVSDEEMRSRVEALGRKIRKEDGVANAVAAFQYYLQELEQEV